MDFDTSRSGTAPNVPNRKISMQGFSRRDAAGSVGSKQRPSTRGAGSSDIADLNASLRHDRTDSNATAYSEAVESYREAIFSWGEPEAAEDLRPEQRFKNPKPVYGGSANRVRLRQGGPGSDAPSADIDSDVAMPGASNLSAKVANVSAIYGVSAKKPKTPNFSRKEGNKTRSRPSSRPSSPMTGTSSNISSNGFPTSPKKTGGQQGVSDAGRPAQLVIGAGSVVTQKAATIKSPLSQPSLRNVKEAISSSSGNLEQSAQINNMFGSSNGLKVPIAGESELEQPSSARASQNAESSEAREPSLGKLSVETSPVDTRSSNARPQSRKLYLGSGQAEVPSPSLSNGPPSRRSRALPTEISVDPFSETVAASPKAELPSSPTNFSPKKNIGILSVMPPGDAGSPKQSKSLSRNKSFPQVRPAPWNVDDTFDDRPPSRQGTAFPFHLAGPDSDGDESIRRIEAKQALTSSVSTPVIIESDISHFQDEKSSPVNIMTSVSVTANTVGNVPPMISSSGAIGADKRRSSLPTSTRPTTRGAGSHAVVSSPVSNYGSGVVAVASGSPVINTSEWAPVYDPVADGFSDIIPDGPPTFTIEVSPNMFFATRSDVILIN